MERRAVAAAGDMPICVGTSHPGTSATRGLSQMAEECGAAAVMVTPSKEGVPLTDDRMVEYFKTVADGSANTPRSPPQLDTQRHL